MLPRKKGWKIIWIVIGILIATVALSLTIFSLTGQQVKKNSPEDPPTMSPRYDLYIGFTARKECVQEDGPYLTALDYDIHVPRLRFIFKKRALDGVMVNWYPHHGEGNEPAFPVLTFMANGQMDAKLCPYQLCPIREGSSKRTIKKAWFTKQNRSCQVVISVVPLPDIPEVLDEALDMEKTKPMIEATVGYSPYIVHVSILSHDHFTWTGECTVRGQDCGNTGGFEFYLALPSWDLRNGRTAEAEFSFENDDIDAEGKLTVRFTPVGSIK